MLGGRNECHGLETHLFCMESVHAHFRGLKLEHLVLISQ